MSELSKFTLIVFATSAIIALILGFILFVLNIPNIIITILVLTIITDLIQIYKPTPNKLVSKIKLPTYKFIILNGPTILLSIFAYNNFILVSILLLLSVLTTFIKYQRIIKVSEDEYGAILFIEKVKDYTKYLD